MASGEDVRGPGGVACRHLGRDESGSPRPGNPVAGRGEPEVDEDHSAVLREDEVGGLDVAVDDGRIVPVEVREGLGGLREVAERRVDGCEPGRALAASSASDRFRRSSPSP